MMISLLVALFARAHAVENLHCEISLTDRAYEIAAGHRVRLEPNQIVIRGNLEVEVHPDTRDATWSIRDAHGFDEVFLVPSHSLHRLHQGDRLYLFAENSETEVLRDGWFAEINREYYMPWDHRRVPIERTPLLYDSPERARPLYATGPLCEAFAEGRHAVVIKTCNDVELRILRERLTPQIRAYEEHRNDAARFVDVGHGRAPYERRVFERTVEGALHFDFVDEKNLREGVKINKMNGAIYRLLLTVESGKLRQSLRAQDRVFLLDAKGEQILDYTIRHVPIGMPEPPKIKVDRDLLAAIPRARHAIVIRKGDR